MSKITSLLIDLKTRLLRFVVRLLFVSGLQPVFFPEGGSTAASFFRRFNFNNTHGIKAMGQVLKTKIIC